MSSYATEGTQQAGVPDGEPEPARTGEPAPEATATDVPDGDGPPDEAVPDEGGFDEGGFDEGGFDDTEPVGDAPYGDDSYGDASYDDASYDDIPDGGDYDTAYADGPHERPKVSKLAVVALITAIISLVPIALIAGIAALIGIRRSGRRGHGMAVSALFIAAAWVIVAGALGAVAHFTHDFTKPEKIVYHEASVFKLQEGQCIDSPNGQQVSVVTCASAHDAEVVGTFTLHGTAWPGSAAVESDASSGCATAAAAYVNPDLAISLAQTYVYPSQSDWTSGTRTVICEVRAASGQLTQSVRGSS